MGAAYPIVKKGASIEEVSKLIEGQYQRALQVLTDNQDKLNALAEQLLTTEVIIGISRFNSSSFETKSAPGREL